MTYNDIYLRSALLGDIRQIKPGSKALTEALLLRVQSNKGMREFEAIRRDIMSDDTVSDDTRTEVLNTKATEECATVTPKVFSHEAFLQIVEAVSGMESIQTAISDKGSVPSYEWLELLASELVEEA